MMGVETLEVCVKLTFEATVPFGKTIHKKERKQLIKEMMEHTLKERNELVTEAKIFLIKGMQNEQESKS